MNKPIRSGAGGGGPSEVDVSFTSDDVVEVNLALCEGPIAGLHSGPRTFYLGNTPLVGPTGTNNFDKFELHVYHGDDDATKVKNVLGGLSSPTVVNQPLAANIPVIRQTEVTQRGEIDILEVRLLVNRLIDYAGNGDVGEAFMKVDIEYREAGKTTWKPFLEEKTFSWEGRLEGTVLEFRRRVPRIDGDWEIRLTNVYDSDPDDGEYREFTWESFQAVNSEDRAYNNTAIVRALSKATDQITSLPDLSGVYRGYLIRIPTNYNPNLRYYDGTWDGTFWRTYSDNPAWVLFELLTNETFGAKAYFPELQVNRFDFYEAAQWCDELVERGKTGTYQPRYTYNDLISRERQGMDLLVYIAGVFGGVLVVDNNGRIGLRVDKPSPIRQVFGVEDVDEGQISYSFTDVETRPNESKISFINPDVGWEEDQRLVEIPDFIKANGRKVDDFTAVGCIDPFEAERRGFLRLLTANTEIITATFRIPRRHLTLEPMQVIGLVDGDQRWGLSGRVKSVLGSTITLRDALYVPVGSPMTLKVTTPSGVHELTVTSNSYSTKSLIITSGRWPGDAPDRASFSLEDNASSIGLVKPFRVMDIAEDEQDANFAVITALEVNVNKWTDADTLTYSGLIDYSGEFIEPEQPQNVRVRSGPEHYIQHADGHIEARIHISWDAPKGYTIRCLYWREGRDEPQGIRATGNQVYIPSVQAGQVYLIILDGKDDRGRGFKKVGPIRHVVEGKLAAPNMPTGWYGVPGVDSITLRTDAPNLEADFKTYSFLGVKRDGGQLVDVGRSQTTEFVRKVKPGDPYVGYRVVGINASGNVSDMTPVISVVPHGVRNEDLAEDLKDRLGRVESGEIGPDDFELLVPQNFSVTSKLAEDGYALTTASLTNIAGATGYDFQFRDIGQNWVSFLSATPSWQSRMVRGGTFQMRVRGISGSKKTKFSDVIEHTAARDTVPPAKPKNVKVESGFEALWVTCDPNTEADFVDYVAWAVPTGDAAPNRTATPHAVRGIPTITIDQLTADTTYDVYLGARDTSGNVSTLAGPITKATQDGVAVSDKDIEEAVERVKTAQSLEYVKVVDSLPSEKLTTLVVLDGKLYRWNGNAYTKSVAADDLDRKLDQADIAENSIAARHLTVGDLQNLAASSLFTTGDPRDWNFNDDKISVVDRNPSSHYSAIRNAPSPYVLMFDETSVYHRAIIPLSIEVNDQERIRVSYWLGGGGNDINVNINASLEYELGDGSTYVIYYPAPRITSIGWFLHSDTGPVPSGAVRLVNFRIYTSNTADANGQGFAANPRVMRANAGELLVDGTIKGNHIEADTIDTGHMRVGAVKADQVAAGAINVEHLAVGDFTNYGGGIQQEALFATWDVENTSGASIYENSASDYSGRIQLVEGASSLRRRGKIPVHPGEEIEYSFAVYRNGVANWDATGGNTKLRFGDQNNAHQHSKPFDDATHNNWTIYTGSFTVQSGVSALTVSVPTDFTTDNTVLISNIQIHKRMSGSLLIDGTVKARHVDTDDLVVNGLAKIKNAWIEEEMIAGTVTADKIRGGSLSITQAIEGGKGNLGQVASRSENPAARINEKPGVYIDPTRIRIQGDTVLADWRAPNFTDIDGGKIYTGSIKTESIDVGYGGNLLEDSRWSYDGANNHLYSSNSELSNRTSYRVRRVNESYSSFIQPTMQIYQGDGYGAGSDSVTFYIDGLENGGASAPCEPGKWYEAHVLMSAHRCDGRVRLIWRDENGSYLGEEVGNSIGGSYSSTNPDLWGRSWVKGKAPSNAVALHFTVYKSATDSGASNSYLFLHKPYLGETHANAKLPTPFSHSSGTRIYGSEIQTGAVTADKMKVNDLSAVSANLGSIKVDTANIERLAVDTLQVKDRAIVQMDTYHEDYSHAGGKKLLSADPSWENIIDFNVYSPQAGGILNINANINLALEGEPLDSSWGFYLWITGKIIESIGGPAYQPMIPLRGERPASPGNNRVQIFGKRQSGRHLKVSSVNILHTIYKR